MSWTMTMAANTWMKWFIQHQHATSNIHTDSLGTRGQHWHRVLVFINSSIFIHSAVTRSTDIHLELFWSLGTVFTPFRAYLVSTTSYSKYVAPLLALVTSSLSFRFGHKATFFLKTPSCRSLNRVNEVTENDQEKIMLRTLTPKQWTEICLDSTQSLLMQKHWCCLVISYMTL